MHNPFDETHRASCLRENLTSSSYGEGLETDGATTHVPRQSLTRQLKYDGFRSLAVIENGRTQLVSRNGHPFNSFTDLRKQLTLSGSAGKTVIDGEIVCLDKKRKATIPRSALPPWAAVLRSLRFADERPGSELVFANKARGRFLEIRGGFKNACEWAGISDLHFHDLRHTFASHWMMAGGDLYVLKNILGHKSIAMTQRYAHLSPEFKRAPVNRMDNIWKAGAKPPTGTTEVDSSSLRSPHGHHEVPLPPAVNGD